MHEADRVDEPTPADGLEPRWSESPAEEGVDMTNVTEAATDDERTDAEESAEESPRDDAHLDDVEVGAGCTEIWEHLAEKRGEAGDD